MKTNIYIKQPSPVTLHVIIIIIKVARYINRQFIFKGSVKYKLQDERKGSRKIVSGNKSYFPLNFYSQLNQITI